MIRKMIVPAIAEIDRLSPSQYQAARNCPFKLVLSRAFDNQQLLPISPNAYLGSVLHKMIELITKGIISDDDAFEEFWKEQVSQKEQSMIAGGSRKLTPLKYSANDFALKKLKVKSLIAAGSNRTSYQNSVYRERLSEKMLSDESKKIIGVVDLIVEEGSKVTIIDFKTGNVFEGDLDEADKPPLKSDYESQLKLYAYLYYLNKSKKPDHLYIVTLDQQYHEVPFDIEDCRLIYNGAVKFIDDINEEVLNDNFASLANCNNENCRFCGFRPACLPYGQWLDKNYRETKDIKGFLNKVNQFGNGSIGVEIKVNEDISLINGLDPADKEELDGMIGKDLTIYNLRKQANSINASANYYTVIYA